MKRNFNNESIINFILRILRASTGRARGKALSYLGAFAKDSSSKVYFGKGVRLINSKSIFLSKNVNFGIMSRLECYNNEDNASTKIILGENTSFGDYLHIGSMNSIEIGSNVLGGSNILIIDHNHGQPRKDIASQDNTPPRDREITSKGPIVIENNVWIGDNVIILANSKIGKGSIISAGSIVNGNVDMHTIYPLQSK